MLPTTALCVYRVGDKGGRELCTTNNLFELLRECPASLCNSYVFPGHNLKKSKNKNGLRTTVTAEARNIYRRVKYRIVEAYCVIKHILRHIHLACYYSLFLIHVSRFSYSFEAGD